MDGDVARAGGGRVLRTETVILFLEEA